MKYFPATGGQRCHVSSQTHITHSSSPATHSHTHTHTHTHTYTHYTWTGLSKGQSNTKRFKSASFEGWQHLQGSIGFMDHLWIHSQILEQHKCTDISWKTNKHKKNFMQCKYDSFRFHTSGETFYSASICLTKQLQTRVRPWRAPSQYHKHSSPLTIPADPSG